MFSIKTEPFGRFQQIKLINTSTGEYVGIIADYGAALNSLVLKKGERLYDLVDGCENFDQLMYEGTQYYKGMVLFPFPNRIKDGKYSFEGKEYQLDINEPDKNNAIHGLVAFSKFAIKRFEAFADRAELEIFYHYKAEHAGYPFHTQLSVIYTLSDKSELTIQSIAENLENKAIPVGLGWHTYFKAAGKIDQMSFTIPSDKIIETDARMNPSGKIMEGNPFENGHIIGHTNLDTGFIFTPGEGVKTTILSEKESDIQLQIWQETGHNKFNYAQYFIPPHRKSIAIEPMTCAADAFNNGLGTIILAAHEKADFSFGIKLG